MSRRIGFALTTGEHGRAHANLGVALDRFRVALTEAVVHNGVRFLNRPVVRVVSWGGFTLEVEVED